MALLAMAAGVLHPSLGLKLGQGGGSHSLRRFRSGISSSSKIRCPSLHTPISAYPTAVENGSFKATDKIPTPKVTIDQDSNPDATVVEIAFGDRLGALLDTMNSLRNLGLHVVKANEYSDSTGKHHRFMITNSFMDKALLLSTGRKIDDPELLETIRLTIITNMLQYHPESSSKLAMGATFGVEPPEQKVDVDIATHIDIYDDGPDKSLLVVETADRPGLLVDLVRIINDINITVQSGEFDTEGLFAKAKFHVSYRNKAIIKSLQQVLFNSLSYFLRRPTTEDASF
ncbi:ACT domain-containing protein DS12, chloroplastic-like isoform X1 [Zingiber officinale]|uniref:ACT domain-containing protein DS12, chloroplastic-like isoform X1 n=1 Tax=Zingiber officinale TaxID=94328 RepID=UPI001C4C26E4|nr:ACT domain-containing protein DS12, chloroplastic-like isoform X1 [Zingiber officinale]